MSWDNPQHPHLSPQNVEVVARRGGFADLPVDLLLIAVDLLSLWGEDLTRKKWCGPVPPYLSPQHVEVVGGRSDVADLPVDLLQLAPQGGVHLGDDVRVVVAHLQVPLHAPAAVLGALPVIPIKESFIIRNHL
jgi:hypothetical protein